MNSTKMFLVPVLAICASILGCVDTRDPDPVTVQREDWSFDNVAGRKLVTDHFEIHSTLRDAPFEDALPEFLEAAYRQYVELLPPKKVGTRMPTYIFADRRQWERFAAERFPARFPVYQRIGGGGFAEGDVCVAYYLGQRSGTLSVLAHEGMHQYFAHHFDVSLPAWLNEGLACYCESYELRQGQPRFTPRHNTFRINALRDALSAQSLLSLEEMLATDAGQVIVRGVSRKVRTYYAQAWAMVVFMRHGADGKYRDGFDRMMADIVSGDLNVVARAAKIRAPEPGATSFGESVFLAYISEDPATFQQEFDAYVHDLCGFRRTEPRSQSELRP